MRHSGGGGKITDSISFRSHTAKLWPSLARYLWDFHVLVELSQNYLWLWFSCMHRAVLLCCDLKRFLSLAAAGVMS